MGGSFLSNSPHASPVENRVFSLILRCSLYRKIVSVIYRLDILRLIITAPTNSNPHSCKTDSPEQSHGHRRPACDAGVLEEERVSLSMAERNGLSALTKRLAESIYE